ncbi:hypothetical protein PHLGIDRAFT_113755 [Phlebiopsis gigantea 11061_1 CR5-6]|uniref:Uncharacterized protein n=1 Tax=Phlebiopsis gigantea (strain 11061_1 CR5-6) TaxID=745531 RepID=A0A0C3S788_PHLG1|nr:hypothetical protein PHLGIDRAFT_113755 [Phlebiopsis gigantea 11061_1 CR5-6]
MPSLRKTNSSPSVRSSPYRALSDATSSQTRTGSRSPRRSSGSDTANRRILADIDWWRVEEAQRQVRGLAPSDQLRPTTPTTDDEELDQEERDPLPAPQLLDFSPAAGENAGSSPLWHNMPGGGLDTLEAIESRFTMWTMGEVDLSESTESASPFEQFAALTLNPVGRVSLERTDSISSAFSDASSDSSFSSPFSTPTLTPMGMDFGFMDCVDVPSADSDDDDVSPFSALSHATRRPARAPIRSTRSASYSFIEDELSATRSRRDVFDDDWSSPASRSPSSFHDEDDPFF